MTLLRDLVGTHIHCRRSPGFGLLGEMNSEILGFMILDPEGCWAVMRSRGLRLSTCFMLGVMRFSFDGLSLSAQRQAFSPQNTSVQLATARDRSMQRSSSADRLDFPTVFHPHQPISWRPLVEELRSIDKASIGLSIYGQSRSFRWVSCFFECLRVKR